MDISLKSCRKFSKENTDNALENRLKFLSKKMNNFTRDITNQSLSSGENSDNMNALDYIIETNQELYDDKFEMLQSLTKQKYLLEELNHQNIILEKDKEFLSKLTTNYRDIMNQKVKMLEKEQEFLHNTVVKYQTNLFPNFKDYLIVIPTTVLFINFEFFYSVFWFFISMVFIYGVHEYEKSIENKIWDKIVKEKNDIKDFEKNNFYVINQINNM